MSEIKNKPRSVAVSLRPYIFEKIAGYRITWRDSKGDGSKQSYFVQSLHVAKDVKRRAKNGLLPRASSWAIRIRMK